MRRAANALLNLPGHHSTAAISPIADWIRAQPEDSE